MARMSVSLRNEQGFHFRQPVSPKTPISDKKGLNVTFKVMHNGRNVHFTSKRMRFSFHATKKSKNANFSSEKVSMLISG